MKILLRCAPSAKDEFSHPLAEAGIDLVSDIRRADMLVIDLRGGAHARGHVGAAIKAGRRDAYGIPLIFVADPDQYGSEDLRRLIGLEFIVAATATQTPLITMVRRCGADMARAEELGIRLSAMASLGMGVSSPEPESSAEVIALLCEPSPAALTVLGGMACLASVNAVMKPSQVLQGLEFKKSDALVILAAKNRRPQGAIVKLLRRHADLNTIPIVVLEQGSTPRHLAYWSNVGADAVLSSDQHQLATTLVERLRRVRHSSIRTESQLRMSALTDRGETSKLASGRYFEACLAERLRRGDRPFALGAIRLDPATGDGHREALSEAAVYLAVGARTTDLFTRVAPDLFLISLSACDRHSAMQTLQAMAGMVRDLRFGPRESSCTFTPHTHLALSAPSLTAADMIETALRGLPSRQSSIPEIA